VPRALRLVFVAGLLALCVPAGALGAVSTLVFQSKPIELDAFGVARGVQGVDSPAVDGNVIGMSADVVDLAGNPVPNAQVMLHHVVFVKVLHPDYTCPSVTDYDGRPSPIPVERFYAEGEEHMTLGLPEGYGYPNKRSDIWGLVYMLMNHHNHADTVRVRYTVRYATGESLTPVKPVWLDVRNCQADPIFSVPGTGGRGSSYEQHTDFTMPESGFFVAGGAHLHGGGLQLQVSNRTWGGRMFTSLPAWGGEMPTPMMHEPGPMRMTSFATTPGLPVRRGDTLRLSALYDNSAPHTRVMGIMMLYLAVGPVDGLQPASVPPAGEMQRPPFMPLPLLRQPRGAIARNIRSTAVQDFTFANQRVSLRQGTTFTWRFVGTRDHDVTLASGPVGFASPSLQRGVYRHRFTRPGTYRLYCSLHPTLMTQIITVRRD
jgi:plastocyanin